MAKSLAELRKSNSTDRAKAQIERLSKKNVEEDSRFWQPTADAAGSGSATIRFLEAPRGEDDPAVKLFSHFFKGPTGKWYAENSLTTLGLADPVSDSNTLLWNTEIEANQNIARKRKRKLHYIANILIINDPKAPENNGTVKLYKFGQKLFEKIMFAASPEFEDQTPCNVFDFFNGKNLKLRFRKADGQRNYDMSEWDQDTSPVAKTDPEIEAIWDKCVSLQQFLDPKNFKSYEELQKKLEQVWPTPSDLTPKERAALGTPAPNPMDDVEDGTNSIGEGAEGASSDAEYFASLAND